jgi:hypothetical protein
MTKTLAGLAALPPKITRRKRPRGPRRSASHWPEDVVIELGRLHQAEAHRGPQRPVDGFGFLPGRDVGLPPLLLLRSLLQ